MKTDDLYLPNGCFKFQATGLEYFKMNTSSSDSEQNSSSLANSDSGYLTTYNLETQSLSTNSSGISTEDLYPQSKPQTELANTVYFCENAVFDEPKLEGPPILSEDISIDLNQFLKPVVLNECSTSTFMEQLVVQSPHIDELPRSTDTIIENSCSNPKNEIFSFDKLKSSTEKAKNSSDSGSNNQIEVKSENLTNKKITTPNKPIINSVNPDLSPDLFSDEEIEEELLHTSTLSVSVDLTQKPIIHSEQMLRNDRKLLRRVQESISGVPPPPSVTILQITVGDMLAKIHSNKELFLTDIFGTGEIKKTENETKSVKSLLICNTKEDVDKEEWPDIVNCRFHGLHYNRTKTSEDFEFYCTKYLTRFVGAETASSCTVWSTNVPNSATKRRNAKLRWGIKSPGRRLSHLAKRRITFSSSNLQASCSAATMSVIGASSSTSKQLIIDARKPKEASKRKSPWKKSPLKRVKTPTSAKKNSRKVAELEEPKPGTSRAVSTKRALFQSPENCGSRSTTSTTSINVPKRNLFLSPRKNSPAKMNKGSPLRLDKKRKRQEEECHPSKFPRSLSFDAHHSTALQAAASGVSLTRRHSELSVSSTSSNRKELSDLHKKKLLWAVSEALRSQQIGMSHPKFRTFAPILCKVVKHLMPDLVNNGPRQPGSTSDRMLRIARQHVFSVSRGRSYDEIIAEVKEPVKVSKPVGYVPPERFKTDEERVKSVLKDKVLNIECNSAGRDLKSPDRVRMGNRDENNRMRIKRQILFDDVDSTRSLNTNR